MVPFSVPIIIRHLLFREPQNLLFREPHKGTLILTTTHVHARGILRCPVSTHPENPIPLIKEYTLNSRGLNIMISAVVKWSVGSAASGKPEMSGLAASKKTRRLQAGSPHWARPGSGCTNGGQDCASKRCLLPSAPLARFGSRCPSQPSPLFYRTHN